MLYRKLGSSNIDVSIIGFGAWAIGGWMWGGADEKQAIAAIQASLDRGVNLLDTAPIYGFGHSEELVGRAIQGRRDQAVIATKCGLIWDREEGEFHFHADDRGIQSRASEKKVYKCLRPASVRDEVEKSLKRLQTDRIDLYQTHWQEKTTPIADTMAELLKLKQEGKIRAIGVSNANVEHIKQYGQIDSDQEKFNLLDRNLAANGQLDFCRQNNIAVFPYSPLANGLLTGKISPDRKFNPGDLRAANLRFRKENIAKINAKLAELNPIAERRQASLAQIVIAWTFSQPGVTCVLCGARDEIQAQENAAAAEIQLTAEEIETIGRTMA
ncbi:MAG: aldo/keto reductase [Pirellulales bacterium]|nr:aldo/keto reductase [Pirellulales bacterium]